MPAPQDSLFFCARGAVTPERLAGDLQQMRRRLANASHVCNLVQDRYLFSVGLLAALQNGQTSVLPPSGAPQAVAASLAGAGAPLILGGQDAHARIARCVEFRETGTRAEPVDVAAIFDAARADIHVFTSGTTKMPECNVKTCSMLRAGASITDQILRDLDGDPAGLALLGTTPPGHMFGLEATIFASLGFGRHSYRDTIFFPADLETASEAARGAGIANLVLITSPAHLRFLESTIMKLPEIRLILSATAPLARRQAERLEARGGLKVMEIYGSTETGSLALRRTASETCWTPAAGFRLESGPGGWRATAPHLPAPVTLGDEVEISAGGRFALLGRVGDMVSVRGKRNRVSALNAILADAPGIADGVFVHVRRDESDLLAIAAVPLADRRQPDDALRSEIRRHLLRHVDQAFVPRKIIFLDSLERTPTGKIAGDRIARLARLAGIAGR